MVEESLGASFHGGLMEAYTLFILWWLFLLGGGCIIGGGCTYRSEVLQLSYCFEDNFVGEVAHIFIFLCKDFFTRASGSKGASLQWNLETFEEGAPCLGAYFFLDLYRSLREVVIVSGSFFSCTFCIPHYLHYIYRLIFQIGFSRGVLSRVMLTKNRCVHFMYARV